MSSFFALLLTPPFTVSEGMFVQFPLLFCRQSVLFFWLPPRLSPLLLVSRSLNALVFRTRYFGFCWHLPPRCLGAWFESVLLSQASLLRGFPSPLSFWACSCSMQVAALGPVSRF